MSLPIFAVSKLIRYAQPTRHPLYTPYQPQFSFQCSNLAQRYHAPKLSTAYELVSVAVFATASDQIEPFHPRTSEFLL